jgi:acyl-CoA synthetase (AMP-forming)/AMP-acid ligase II
MYGQTEATARMAYVPPEMLDIKLGSAGIAIPGGRFSVAGGEAASEVEDGGEVVAGSDAVAGGTPSGEIVYEGPNVMLGYASGADDLRLGDVMGGVLRTGDLGYVDADGYVFLIGRSKRIAKVFGIRVNLDEVELMLQAHGPAAVVGADSAVWGFCAFGDEDELSRLRTQLARELHLHHSAVHLSLLDEIPRSGSGKVDYAALERRAEGS